MLGIAHPRTGAFMEFRTELPRDLARLRAVLDATGANGPHSRQLP